jgi:hypothetical protein
VGTLLRERFGGARVIPSEPAAAIAAGQRRAELGDFAGARAAFESARSHTDYAERAGRCLHELLVEQSCRELAAIIAEGPVEQGSPERERVVQIGQALYLATVPAPGLASGIGLMREVYRRFRERRPGDARTLESQWDGIGGWQG